MTAAGTPDARAGTLARADGVLGELVLRRTGDGGVELLSGGVFLMDDGDTSTERALAARVLDHSGGTDLHVVVGGLGLGFTAAAALDHARVARVTVVEVEPVLVGWVRDGLVPATTGVLDDVRVEVLVGDVADVLPTLPPRSADAVLLDVDNGPGFLVHPRNAAVYRAPFLAAAAAVLRPGGRVAVWSADPAPALADALTAVTGGCTEERLVVRRAGRDLDYWLYVSVGVTP